MSTEKSDGKKISLKFLISNSQAGSLIGTEDEDKNSEWSPETVSSALGTNNETDVISKITIPAATGGLILGKGGSSIKSIAEESGAKILMTGKDEALFTHERVLTLSEQEDVEPYVNRGTTYASPLTSTFAFETEKVRAVEDVVSVIHVVRPVVAVIVILLEGTVIHVEAQWSRTLADCVRERDVLVSQINNMNQQQKTTTTTSINNTPTRPPLKIPPLNTTNVTTSNTTSSSESHVVSSTSFTETHTSTHHTHSHHSRQSSSGSNPGVPASHNSSPSPRVSGPVTPGSGGSGVFDFSGSDGESSTTPLDVREKRLRRKSHHRNLSDELLFGEYSESRKDSFMSMTSSKSSNSMSRYQTSTITEDRLASALIGQGLEVVDEVSVDEEVGEEVELVPPTLTQSLAKSHDITVLGLSAMLKHSPVRPKEAFFGEPQPSPTRATTTASSLINPSVITSQAATNEIINITVPPPPAAPVSTPTHSRFFDAKSEREAAS
eukprot:gene24538-30896_t